MRILAVDLGKKRIGIAVGETTFAIANPRETITASGSLAKDAVHVDTIARREEATLIVVGEPHNDEDDRMGRICRQFGDELRKLGWNVHMVDETMTSINAENALRETTDLRAAARKKRRDGEAACQILERYFHG